jgi:predicted metal-dependent hydrolase
MPWFDLVISISVPEIGRQTQMKTEIIRSAKRKKTVQARLVDGVLQVRAPARLSDAELAPIIDDLAKKLTNRARKAKLEDKTLERRARELNRLYFDDQLKWNSIRWVTNQNKRAGSCTPARGSIRISHRVAEMPAFVRDYVLVHELAHLLEPNHSDKFWEWVNRYPRTERARGFLMGAGMEPIET